MAETEIVIPESFYFHGDEINQFIHIQVPVALIKEKVFRSVSDSAKLLYGLLLNRTGLSIRNGWTDENDRTYIIYTVDSLMEELGIGSTKAKNMFAELTNINGSGVGLIKKVRVLNKPSRIYVMNFMEVFRYLQSLEESKNNKDITLDDNADSPMVLGETFGRKVQKSEVNTSEMAKILVGRDCVPRSDADASHGRTGMRPTDGRDCDLRTDANASVNNKDINYNNMINNNHINSIQKEESWQDMLRRDVMEEINATRELIKDNISYDLLIEDTKHVDKDMLDELIEIMVEECVVGGDEYIGGNKVPHMLIRSRFEKYNMMTIQYVLGCLQENTTDVKNTRKYLLAVLYNAPNTMSSYYKLRVQHDMNQPDWGKPLVEKSKSSEEGD